MQDIASRIRTKINMNASQTSIGGRSDSGNLDISYQKVLDYT